MTEILLTLPLIQLQLETCPEFNKQSYLDSIKIITFAQELSENKHLGQEKQKKALKKLKKAGIGLPNNLKISCCEKYKKAEKKRCKKCPCHDLVEKVA